MTTETAAAQETRQQTQTEEATVELIEQQRRRDALRADFAALAMEDETLADRLFRAIGSGSTVEEVTSWKARREQISYLIKQNRYEQTTLESQINASDLKIENLRREAERLRSVLPELEARVRAVAANVVAAQQQKVEAQLIIDSAPLEHARLEDQVRRVNEAIARIG